MAFRPLPGGSPKVAEYVVHPAHIPLEVESQAAHVRRLRNLRKSSRLLGNADHLRILLVNGLVKLANEFDCFKVMVATHAVRHPFAILAAVVEVEHGGHRIDPEARNAETVDPGKGASDQKASHFGPAVIEDQRVPFGMPSLPWVLMLEKTSPVKPGEGELVGWEMGGYPIDDHSYSRILACIHQDLEFAWRTIPVRGCVEARYLIAPGSTEGIFAGRKKLHVRETHVEEVRGQAIGQFQIAQGAILMLVKLPGTKMHLINRKRLLPWVFGGKQGGSGDPVGDKFAVAYHGGVPWRRFAPKGKGVALLPQDAIRPEHPEFVLLSDPGIGHEKLATSAGTEGAHGE